MKKSTPPNLSVAAYYYPCTHPHSRWDKAKCPGFTEWDLVRNARPRFPDPSSPTLRSGDTRIVLVFLEGFSTTGTTKLFDFKSGDKNFEVVKAIGLAPGLVARFDPLTGSVSVVSATK